MGISFFSLVTGYSMKDPIEQMKMTHVLMLETISHLVLVVSIGSDQISCSYVISFFILIYFNTSFVHHCSERKGNIEIYLPLACVQSDGEEENESKMLIANFQRTCGHCYN